MEPKYHRLCAEERKVLANMRQAGISQTEIARALGRSQGTISKELARNRGGRGYRPQQAERMARQRQAAKPPRPRAISGPVREQVEARLRLKHSPDQISRKLAREGMQVSRETIYRHISSDRKACGDLASHLRINGRRRYRRRCKTGRGEKIAERVDISQRPAVVECRARYGDWEADLIQGKAGSGYLLVVYERKSRLGRLHWLADKGSEETAKGLVKLLDGLKVHTITYDNGLEFARHGWVNELLGCESYFCKPYHSWEKGGVENFNGLVRQYFPKGHDFSTVSRERLREVEEELNNRPRHVLCYDCPNDLLDLLEAA